MNSAVIINLGFMLICLSGYVVTHHPINLVTAVVCLLLAGFSYDTK